MRRLNHPVYRNRVLQVAGRVIAAADAIRDAVVERAGAERSERVA